MPKSRRRRPQSTRQPRRSHPPRVKAATGLPEPEPRRYTPPDAGPRFRPTWHKVVGSVSVVFGVALIALNFAEDEDVGILPGGHSPLYMLAGLIIGSSALWWFGAFDRPT